MVSSNSTYYTPTLFSNLYSLLGAIAYLLLRGISVIKANDKFPFIHLGKVLIEQRSLGVTNMQVTTRLRREPSDHLSLFRIW